MKSKSPPLPPPSPPPYEIVEDERGDSYSTAVDIIVSCMLDLLIGIVAVWIGTTFFVH